MMINIKDEEEEGDENTESVSEMNQMEGMCHNQENYQPMLPLEWLDQIRAHIYELQNTITENRNYLGQLSNLV